MIDHTLELSPDTAQALIQMADRITDLAYMLDKTFHLAYTDPISGAPNMLAVQYKLELTITEATRTNRPMSIFLADGDNLRRYNESDFLAGDRAILHLYQALKVALRSQDFVGRWRMGDEFLIILPDTDLSQAILLAERVRAVVQHSLRTLPQPITISVGVATFPDHGRSISALLSGAERSLKRAKQNGKNRIALPDP